MAAGKIQVYYYDAKGRAEVTRLVLALADKEFEDIRISREDWLNVYKDKSPGNIPWATHNGRPIFQSFAMAYYFAEEFSLCGKTNLERTRVLEVMGLCIDVVGQMANYFFAPDEATKKELGEKLQGEAIPRFFGYFVRLLRENAPHGVFVGRELTLADIYLFDVVDSLKQHLKWDACAHYEEVKAMVTRLVTNPRLKKYLENRKETAF